MTKLYSEPAEWWPRLSSPEDYEEEAAFSTETLKGGCRIPPRTLLELGSFTSSVVPFDRSELEAGSYELFLAQKPGVR